MYNPDKMNADQIRQIIADKTAEIDKLRRDLEEAENKERQEYLDKFKTFCSLDEEHELFYKVRSYVKLRKYESSPIFTKHRNFTLIEFVYNFAEKTDPENTWTKIKSGTTLKTDPKEWYKLISTVYDLIFATETDKEWITYFKRERERLECDYANNHYR